MQSRATAAVRDRLATQVENGRPMLCIREYISDQQHNKLAMLNINEILTTVHLLPTVSGHVRMSC